MSFNLDPKNVGIGNYAGSTNSLKTKVRVISSI